MSSSPTILTASRDGIDPIRHEQVPHKSIAFDTTLWTYENCELAHDHPFTVRTHRGRSGSYMYTVLKLTPGLYVCTLKCSSHVANCTLEILQRQKDYDGDDANNQDNPLVSRHTRVCSSKQPEGDLRLLVAGDTDAEVRLVFAEERDAGRLLVPSFKRLELRSRSRVPMALKSHIPSGYYKPKPMQYTTMDLQRMAKRVHYVINWLRTLDEQLNDALRLVSDPLWDIEDPTSAFDYTQAMQGIQNGLSTEAPSAFVATSCCYSIFLRPGVRIPLMSNTLITELLRCINRERVDSVALVRTLHHSLKYINFMVLEYTEFKQLVSEHIAALAASANDTCTWNAVQIQTGTAKE